MSDEPYLQTKEELQEYHEVDFDLQMFMRGDRPPNYNNAVPKCLTYLDVIHSFINGFKLWCSKTCIYDNAFNATALCESVVFFWVFGAFSRSRCVCQISIVPDPS